MESSYEDVYGEPEYGLDAKWHPDVIQEGYTVIPNILIENYSSLRLNPSEFLILVNLINYWWDAKRLPYPSVETLAERTNMSTRSVTRIITALEKRKFIKRIRRKHTSNVYSLEPLVSRLLDLAELYQAIPAKRRAKGSHL